MRVLPRGRAIVRSLAPHVLGRTFRPGDFVLMRSGGLLAEVQSIASGGALNHAALIVDPTGGLIEVDPQLVPGTQRLRRTHLHDYLAANIPCWVGYVESQAGTRQSVVDFAERLLASEGRVGVLGAGALLLHLLVGVAPRELTARHAWLRPLHLLCERHAFVLRAEHSWLAGEFVARALERAGFMWDSDPAYVTPAALFERFYLADDSEHSVVVSLASRRQAARRRRGPTAPPLDAHATTNPRPATLPPLEPAPALPTTAPADGVRAVLQVALLALGGIALAHSIESLVRQVRQA